MRQASACAANASQSAISDTTYLTTPRDSQIRHAILRHKRVATGQRQHGINHEWRDMPALALIGPENQIPSQIRALCQPATVCTIFRLGKLGRK
jgi:hypothetical protein